MITLIWFNTQFVCSLDQSQHSQTHTTSLGMIAKCESGYMYVRLTYIMMLTVTLTFCELSDMVDSVVLVSFDSSFDSSLLRLPPLGARLSLMNLLVGVARSVSFGRELADCTSAGGTLASLVEAVSTCCCGSWRLGKIEHSGRIQGSTIVTIDCFSLSTHLIKPGSFSTCFLQV